MIDIYKILRYSRFTFLGLIVGYILAFLLGTWIWLDMRINVALIIPAAIILCIIISSVNKCLNSIFWLILSEIIVCIEFLVIYWSKLDAVTVIPGIFFKEAFYLSFISLKTANVFLAAVLILGNLLWFLNTHCDIYESCNN